MSTEPHEHPIPYPQGPTEGGGLVLTYSLREVIDQMNRKLDVLPTILHQTEQNTALGVKMQAEITALTLRTTALELAQGSAATVSVFKDAVWRKIVAASSIIGVIAGVAIAVINILI